jgi:hypothetical protein
MTGVRTTAMIVVVGDVASLSRGAVKGATHGVVPWRTVALTVIADDSIPLSLGQRMTQGTTIVSNAHEVILGEGQEYGKL